jgi:hypothetical protein
MSSDGIDQKLKGVLISEKACSGNRKQPCGEELAFLGLVTEADFSPRDCRSDSPLCSVIGWLHTLMFKECEQVIPMFEQTTGSSGHIRVGTQLVGLETIAHAGPDRNRFFYKGMPIHKSFFEGVPQPEHSSDLGEHPFGKLDPIRTPAAVLQSFEVPDDMSPADLAQTFMIGIVGRKHV